MSRENPPYADFIKALPRPDIPLKEAGAHLLPSPLGQVVFWELPAGAVIPPHSHGAQWGIVVDGEIELTIDGVAHTFGRGDAFFIGDGVVHSGKLTKDCRAIDFFADPDRYQPTKE